jgi:UDP-N-acetylglucosamine--N-acetylmuramyl-(pentapeptide) pyrophosphoryl-undecaprenol N-acetylglucosamine transferase
MLLYGYLQAWRILKGYRPDRVMGVGGYASGPVVMAAKMMGLNCFIHEQNALPGFTNKTLARFCERVFISLEESAMFFSSGKTLLTGNPIRKEILDAFAHVSDGMPHEKRDTHHDTIRLLVFGGSAGAHSINMNVIAALPFLSGFRERLAITHQTGEKDLAEVTEAYQREGFRGETLPFIDNMAKAYHDADLVVCRAGATTVAEVTACGKACVFIPYPYAVDDHQRRNAEALLKKGAAFMILDRELSGESLARLVTELIDNPERIAEAGRRARGLARPDAARVIVDEMLRD